MRRTLISDAHLRPLPHDGHLVQVLDAHRPQRGRCSRSCQTARVKNSPDVTGAGVRLAGTTRRINGTGAQVGWDGGPAAGSWQQAPASLPSPWSGHRPVRRNAGQFAGGRSA